MKLITTIPKEKIYHQNGKFIFIKKEKEGNQSKKKVRKTKISGLRKNYKQIPWHFYFKYLPLL